MNDLFLPFFDGEEVRNAGEEMTNEIEEELDGHIMDYYRRQKEVEKRRNRKKKEQMADDYPVVFRYIYLSSD